MSKFQRLSPLLAMGAGAFLSLVCVSSSQAASYPAGTSPHWVEVADVNGDGISDLIVASPADNTVSVLLGNADGTFQTAVAYSVGVGMSPIAVAVADLNGDNKPDIAVADFGGNMVTVLFNSGTGTFNPGGTIAVGTNPTAITIADVNGDGMKDIITANYNSGNISVALALGSGAFNSAVAYPAGTNPSAIVAADFNGDNKLDLAVAAFGDDAVVVLLNAGAGMFSAPVSYPTGAGSDGVAAGDFNGDGHLDLVVANHDSGTVSVLLGVGDGSFDAATNLPSGNGSRQPLIGDLDGSGQLDFVLVNDTDNEVQIFKGAGDGTFDAPVSIKIMTGTTFGTPVSGALADFNKDGILDVVVTDITNNNVRVINGPLPGEAPTIDSLDITDSSNESISDTEVGTTVNFVAVATDPAGLPLTYTWDFGDGMLATGATVTHAYATEGTFDVTLTVDNGKLNEVETTSIDTFAPNSGSDDVTNFEDGTEDIDPETGIGIEQTKSDGGIIMLHVDMSQMSGDKTRAANKIMTVFDGLGGRSGSSTGEAPAQKFKTPGVFIATTTITDAATGASKGNARKTLIVGRDEVGLPALVTAKPANRKATKATLKGTFTFVKTTSDSLAPFAATAKPDTVTMSGKVEMPAGLDLSKPQTFDFSAGNVFDSVNVNTKGALVAPTTTGKVLKLQFHYPKPPKAPRGTAASTLTAAGQFATFQVTLSGTNLSGAGFESEGVTAALTAAEKVMRSIKRSVQVAFSVGGVTYSQPISVDFKYNSKANTGSIGGRSAD